MGEERTARIGQKRPGFHLGVLQSCTQLWLATCLIFEGDSGRGWGWGRGGGGNTIYTIYASIIVLGHLD
jgi:hypothetical protein